MGRVLGGQLKDREKGWWKGKTFRVGSGRKALNISVGDYTIGVGVLLRRGQGWGKKK